MVAALGAFIYFYERDLPSADERQERGQNVLALDVGEIRALTIADPLYALGEVRGERLLSAEPGPPLEALELPASAVEDLRRSLETVLEPVAVSLAP